MAFWDFYNLFSPDNILLTIFMKLLPAIDNTIRITEKNNLWNFDPSWGPYRAKDSQFFVFLNFFETKNEVQGQIKISKATRYHTFCLFSQSIFSNKIIENGPTPRVFCPGHYWAQVKNDPFWHFGGKFKHFSIKVVRTPKIFGESRCKVK